MNENTVALAAIALAVTAVGGIVWLAKYFAQTLAADLKEHAKAAVELTTAATKQADASGEVLVFMKNLNGKLAKATIKTIQEQGTVK